MKNPSAAAILNFFFMGLGTLYLGRRKPLGGALTVVALLLTYVEQVGVKDQAPSFFPIMAGAVFLGNTFLALDGYQEAQALNSAASLAKA